MENQDDHHLKVLFKGSQPAAQAHSNLKSNAGNLLCDLPVEILETIAEYTTNIEDVQSLRLVCKAIHNPCTNVFGRRAFRTVTCIMTRKSVRRLCSLTSTRWIAPNIKTVDINTWALLDTDDEESSDTDYMDWKSLLPESLIAYAMSDIAAAFANLLLAGNLEVSVRLESRDSPRGSIRHQTHANPYNHLYQAEHSMFTSSSIMASLASSEYQPKSLHLPIEMSFSPQMLSKLDSSESHMCASLENLSLVPVRRLRPKQIQPIQEAYTMSNGILKILSKATKLEKITIRGFEKVPFKFREKLFDMLPKQQLREIRMFTTLSSFEQCNLPKFDSLDYPLMPEIVVQRIQGFGSTQDPRSWSWTEQKYIAFTLPTDEILQSMRGILASHRLLLDSLEQKIESQLQVGAANIEQLGYLRATIQGDSANLNGVANSLSSKIDDLVRSVRSERLSR